MDDSSQRCMPDTPDADPVQTISQAQVGTVARCRCGHLHLNLQYLTLRFEPDAFRDLAALLAFAQRRLDHDPALSGDTSPDGASAVH